MSASPRRFYLADRHGSPEHQPPCGEEAQTTGGSPVSSPRAPAQIMALWTKGIQAA